MLALESHLRLQPLREQENRILEANRSFTDEGLHDIRNQARLNSRKPEGRAAIELQIFDSESEGASRGFLWRDSFLANKTSPMAG